MYMIREEKYLSNDFQLEQFDSTRTVMNLSLRPIKFMSLMSCSAVKMYFFSNVYDFLSKKISTFKKLYEIGINKLFFSSEEKYYRKKEKYGWP